MPDKKQILCSAGTRTQNAGFEGAGALNWSRFLQKKTTSSTQIRCLKKAREQDPEDAEAEQLLGLSIIIWLGGQRKRFQLERSGSGVVCERECAILPTFSGYLHSDEGLS